MTCHKTEFKYLFWFRFSEERAEKTRLFLGLVSAFFGCFLFDTAHASCPNGLSIIVVRHADRAGQDGEGLSQTGVGQARQLANRIIENSCQVDSLFVSRNRPRHMQTAEHFYNCLQQSNLPQESIEHPPSVVPWRQAATTWLARDSGAVVYVMSSGQIPNFIRQFDWTWASGAVVREMPEGLEISEQGRFGEVYWLNRASNEEQWTLRIHKSGNQDDSYSFESPSECTP